MASQTTKTESHISCFCFFFKRLESTTDIPCQFSSDNLPAKHIHIFESTQAMGLKCGLLVAVLAVNDTASQLHSLIPSLSLQNLGTRLPALSLIEVGSKQFSFAKVRIQHSPHPAFVICVQSSEHALPLPGVLFGAQGSKFGFEPVFLLH